MLTSSDENIKPSFHPHLRALLEILTKFAPTAKVYVTWEDERVGVRASFAIDDLRDVELRDSDFSVWEDPSRLQSWVDIKKVPIDNGGFQLKLDCQRLGVASASLVLEPESTTKEIWAKLEEYCTLRLPTIATVLCLSIQEWRIWYLEARLGQILASGSRPKVIVDAEGLIHFQQLICAKHDQWFRAVFKITNNRLRCRSATKTAEFLEAVSRSLTSGETQAYRHEPENGDLRYFVLARPLGAVSDKGANCQFKQLVALTITDSQSNGTTPQMLRQIFNLTPAESELGVAIVGGVALADYARTTGTMLSTVRWHQRVPGACELFERPWRQTWKAK